LLKEIWSLNDEDNLRTARAFLKAGANINAIHEIPDDQEIFPASSLWYALARGKNPRLARFLLSSGASPDYCLFTVVRSDDLSLVRLVLKAGSNTELRGHGETPLVYAARLGHEAIAVAPSRREPMPQRATRMDAQRWTTPAVTNLRQLRLSCSVQTTSDKHLPRIRIIMNSIELVRKVTP
jgi:ankyrin repeat protein